MALRVPPAKSAPESRRPTAERFSDLALTALRERDLKRYAAVFAETTEVEDVQRRYQARKAVIERGLESGTSVPEADYGTLFHAIAAGTIALLQEEAREPLPLHYPGAPL